MLTDEQRKLAAENHNLIYAFLNDRGLSLDDYYDVAAIGLCMAAAKYDATKGFTFSTFAYRVIMNQILMEMRKNRAKVRTDYQTISLEDPIPGEIDNFFVKDTIADSGVGPDEQLQFKELIHMVDALEPREKSIVNLSYYGFRQREIADKFGISQSYVSRLLEGAQNKLGAQI